MVTLCPTPRGLPIDFCEPINADMGGQQRCWWIEKKLAPLFQLPRQEIEPATPGLHFSYHLQSERAIYKRPISVSQNNAPSLNVCTWVCD